MIVEDYLEKEGRVGAAMQKKGVSVAVVGRQDNFAWLTTGGANGIMECSESGDALLVLDPPKRTLVAYSMDADRILNEQLGGIDCEVRKLHWYDGSLGNAVIDLVKDRHCVADIDLGSDSCKSDPGFFHSLHYPLTPTETKNYASFALAAERVLWDVGREIVAGMTEREVEQRLRAAFAAAGMRPIVVLVGSDARIEAYRHPTPTDKVIERVVMMAPAVRKNGLTIPITRMVSFGAVDPETARRYDSVRSIAAHTIAMSRPGQRFAEIIEVQKSLYSELGLGEEWRGHFLGGITGYIVNDPTKGFDSTAALSERQTFNWYITASGVKCEETVLSGAHGGTVLSVGGIWPTTEFDVSGFKVNLPDILQK